jgi:hypothetical protein
MDKINAPIERHKKNFEEFKSNLGKERAENIEAELKRQMAEFNEQD